MTKRRYSKRRIEVAYWTAKDDIEGSCSPSGHAVLYVSENYDVNRIYDLKRLKRRNEESRVYDISEN
jgi:hypothetical protein